jgi:hypothetical protein
MASETKAQRIKRLQREIDSIEENIEKKRQQLQKIENRVEPEADMLMVRVRFDTNAKVYTYLLIKTPVGYFSTGYADTGHFRDWDAVCDWLESRDVVWHTGVEVLAGTGELALPAKGIAKVAGFDSTDYFS